MPEKTSLKKWAGMLADLRVIAAAFWLFFGSIIWSTYWVAAHGKDFFQDQVQAAVKENFEAIEARISNLEPQPLLVDVDEGLTEVLGPCRNGEPCALSMRARRTNLGRKCEIIKDATDWRITDSGGFTITPKSLTRPTNLNHRYRFLKPLFVFNGAAAGDAELEITTRYLCPDPKTGELNLRKSETIISGIEFEIVDTE